MTRYAAQTQVPSDRSRTEIEKTLRRYGASQFAYGWDRAAALIGFVAHGRQIRFVLPLPDQADKLYTHTPTGRRRSAAQAEAEFERAARQRWRALALVVKAKLEAVEAGIAVFEDEFLAYTVLPGGQTVAEHIQDRITVAYRSGEVAELMPMPTTRRAITAGGEDR